MLINKKVPVGVEIELENLRNYTRSSYKERRFVSILTEKDHWHVINDGSLRNNGLEFVMMDLNTSGPLVGNDIIKALKHFRKVMDTYILEGHEPPILSERTSLHIHVDVRDMKIEQINKLIILYSIFEKIFFKWSLPERYYNNYCRPISLHKDIKERLSKVLHLNSGCSSPGEHFKFAQANKYDGINIKPITSLGSVEFRIFRGTYDINDIIDWINLLLGMRNSAIEDSSLDNLLEIPTTLSKYGIENLIDKVFGEPGQILKPHASNADVLEGVRLSQDLIIERDLINISQMFNSQEVGTTHLKAFKENIKKEYK